MWVTEIKEEEHKFSLTMVEGLTGGHKFQFVLHLEVLKRTCLASLVTTDFEEGACLLLEFFFLIGTLPFFEWLGHALETPGALFFAKALPKT